MRETDFNTRSQGSGDGFEEEELRGFTGVSRKRKLSFWQLLWLVILLLVLGVTAYFVFIGKKNSGDPQPAAGKAVVSAPVDSSRTASDDQGRSSTDRAVIPSAVPLQTSDPEVRRQARAISNHGRLLNLLQENDLIRRFVAVIDNISRGESPRSWLESVAPLGRPKAAKRGGRIYLDPSSYHRYDELTAIILSLDDQYCVDLYLVFEPQIQEAYRELGNSPRSFQEALQAAVEQLLQTPVKQTPVELEEKMLSYAHADDRLESLNPAQKHFLRFGPDNLQKIQKKIGAMFQALLERKIKPKQKDIP